jgi:hypothetical protein
MQSEFKTHGMSLVADENEVVPYYTYFKALVLYTGQEIEERLGVSWNKN